MDKGTVGGIISLILCVGACLWLSVGAARVFNINSASDAGVAVIVVVGGLAIMVFLSVISGGRSR